MEKLFICWQLVAAQARGWQLGADGSWEGWLLLLAAPEGMFENNEDGIEDDIPLVESQPL